MWNRNVLNGVLIFALMCCSGFVWAKETSSPLQQRKCPELFYEKAWSGWSARCYRLHLVSSHLSKAPSHLDVVVLRSALRDETFPPLFFLGRGLGFSLEDHVEDFSRMASAALLLQRDVVLIQGRGSSKKKDAFSCPQLEAWVMKGVLTEKWPSSSQTWSSQFQKCLKDRKHRYILRDSTILQGAQDVEYIRRLLGYPKIQMWANGEGVLLAWMVAQISEEHVESMILNGWWSEIAPSEQTWTSLMSFAEDWVASCQRDVFCKVAFPKLREKFLRLLKLVSKAPRRLLLPAYAQEPARTFLLHRRSLLLFLFRLSQRKDLSPFFPLLISESEQGRFGLLRVLASLLWPRYLQKVATGAYLGAMCSAFTQPELVPLWRLRQEKDLSADPQLDLAPANLLPMLCSVWPSRLRARLSLHKINVRTLWLDQKREEFIQREQSWFGHFFFRIQFLQRALYAPESALVAGCSRRVAFAFLEGRKIDTACFSRPKKSAHFFLRRENIRLVSTIMGDDPTFVFLFFACLLIFLSVMILKPLSFSFHHWGAYLPKKVRDLWDVGVVERPTASPYMSNPYTRQEEPRGMPLTAYLGRWWAIVEVFLVFVFLFLFLQKIYWSDFPVSLLFLSRSSGTWFGVALLATVGAHLLCLFSLLSWFNRYWSFWARLHYSVVSIAAIVFLWMLHAIGVLGGIVL